MATPSVVYGMFLSCNCRIVTPIMLYDIVNTADQGRLAQKTLRVYPAFYVMTQHIRLVTPLIVEVYCDWKTNI